MTSFNMQANSIIEWNNNPNLVLRYTPKILPLVERLGRVRIRTYGIKENFTTKDFTLDLIPKLDPTLITFESNVLRQAKSYQISSNYYGFTRKLVVKAPVEQEVERSFWEKMSSNILSILNIDYDSKAYNGDGLNSGLITGVTPTTGTLATITATGQALTDEILTLARSLNQGLGNPYTYPVYVMVSGTAIMNVLLKDIYDSNHTISQILTKNNIVVDMLDPLVSGSTNRIDCVDFSYIKGDRGMMPSVLQEIKEVVDVNNNTLFMHLGYQSVAVSKENTLAVASKTYT